MSVLIIGKLAKLPQSGLPPGEGMVGERVVDGNEAQILDLALGEQKAVEGVAGGWISVKFGENVVRLDSKEFDVYGF